MHTTVQLSVYSLEQEKFLSVMSLDFDINHVLGHRNAYLSI